MKITLLVVLVIIPASIILLWVIMYSINGDKWEAERKAKDSLAVIERVKADSTAKAIEAEKERAFNALPKAERERIEREQQAKAKAAADESWAKAEAEARANMQKVFEDRTSLRVMQNKAEEAIAATLKDPDSYKGINVSDVQMKGDGFFVVVQYSATNSFNARIQNLKTVKFDMTGRTVVSIE